MKAAVLEMAGKQADYERKLDKQATKIEGERAAAKIARAPAGALSTVLKWRASSVEVQVAIETAVVAMEIIGAEVKVAGGRGEGHACGQ